MPSNPRAPFPSGSTACSPLKLGPVVSLFFFFRASAKGTNLLRATGRVVLLRNLLPPCPPLPSEQPSSASLRCHRSAVAWRAPDVDLPDPTAASVVPFVPLGRVAPPLLSPPAPFRPGSPSNLSRRRPPPLPPSRRIQSWASTAAGIASPSERGTATAYVVSTFPRPCRPSLQVQALGASSRASRPRRRPISLIPSSASTDRRARGPEFAARSTQAS